jgi:hypothetical protein
MRPLRRSDFEKYTFNKSGFGVARVVSYPSARSFYCFECKMKFLDWLTLLFIGLKLTGQITWPWVWVLFPFWYIFAAGLVATMLTFLLTKVSKRVDR